MSIHYAFHVFRNCFKALTLSAKSKRLALKERVLVIAPHPDDEALGCGSLIGQAVREGKALKIVILTRGENLASNHTMSKEVLTERRHDLTLRSNASLGVRPDDIIVLDYKDGKVSLDDAEQTALLQEVIERFAPQQVFVTSTYDEFPDHQNALRITRHILDGLWGEGQVRPQLYEYLVWFWFFFHLRNVPQLFGRRVWHLPVDRDSKKEALRIYLDETDEHGTYVSGKLPPEMISALMGRKEYYLEG